MYRLILKENRDLYEGNETIADQRKICNIIKKFKPASFKKYWTENKV